MLVETVVVVQHGLFVEGDAELRRGERRLRAGPSPSQEVNMKRRSGFAPMIHRVGALALACVVSAALPQGGFAQQKPVTSDIARVLSRVGTWKLNLAKSKYDPGPSPKSATRTIEARGNGTRQRTEGIDATGNRVAYEYTASYDGKDYPITGTGIPNEADTIALRRIDDFTIEATLKRAGKVVQTTRSVLSKDGRVLTYTARGINPSGQPTNNVTVWELQ
jgi:hypothetical protein